VSILSTISKPEDRPPILTICGDAGTGKTSLAATFPSPIFIRAEDGLQSIPQGQRPDAFPVLKDSETLFEQLLALLKEDHSYSTLVIDSVSKLEEIFVREILETDGRAKGINQALGGYGNGPSAVAAMHGRVRKAAGMLNEKKHMAIVFIAHADLETMRPPDMDDYTRYSLRMMPKSLPHYVDDVDLVGFVRLTSALRGDDGDRKKVISDGSRELIAYATAASVSKNRFGITEPLDFELGTNPLEEALGIAARKKSAAARNPSANEEIEQEKAA
jgi:hypothetical protein